MKQVNPILLVLVSLAAMIGLVTCAFSDFGLSPTPEPPTSTATATYTPVPTETVTPAPTNTHVLPTATKQGVLILPTDTPFVSPLPTPTDKPTATPTQFVSPLPTPTPKPAFFEATESINVRTCPSLDCPILGQLQDGDSRLAIGIDSTANWVLIDFMCSTYFGYVFVGFDRESYINLSQIDVNYTPEGTIVPGELVCK